MTTIVGQHGCKADAKGRINIPTALKNKLLPFMNDEFVIKRAVFKDCLELHPKVLFDEVMQKVMQTQPLLQIMQTKIRFRFFYKK